LGIDRNSFRNLPDPENHPTKTPLNKQRQNSKVLCQIKCDSRCIFKYIFYAFFTHFSTFQKNKWGRADMEKLKLKICSFFTYFLHIIFETWNAIFDCI
jgi:hypothetical protein